MPSSMKLQPARFGNGNPRPAGIGLQRFPLRFKADEETVDAFCVRLPERQGTVANSKNRPCAGNTGSN